MKKHDFLSVLAAASLAFSGLAFAQGHDGRQGRDGRNSQQVDAGRYDQQDRDGRHGPQRRGDARGDQWQRGQSGAQRRGPPEFSHAGGRGAGPNHDFYRGGRLPREYRNWGYVVNDWRGHYLSAPPRGYQWVQTGGDYVMVRISNGIIFQINLGQ